MRFLDPGTYARISAADPLPKPDVDVRDEYTGHSHRVKLSARRDGANAGVPREWEGEGVTVQEAFRKSVEKMLDDPVTGEYVRK